MLGALLLVIFLLGISQVIFSIQAKRHSFFSKKMMNQLFFYHLIFNCIYYTYALFSRSDSKNYFARPHNSNLPWGDFFGTGTTFIDFVSWPFINILHFNYEMMMVLFSWFGFIGFLYAYLFFRESIPLRIKIFNLDFLALVLFFPNMHFWTSSLGKGAAIFMGLMFFAYAINNPKERWLLLIIGSVVIFFVRPHIFLFVAIGTVLGFLTGREKVAFWKKLIIYLGMVGVLLIAQDQILGVAGLEDSENLVSGFEDFSNAQAEDLSKSGSGVDMSAYPLPVKLFTFWFRPLFFDAPGILGIIVSIENLIYLLLFFKILKKDFIRFLIKSPVLVKMSLSIFFLSSLAMAFVMSNLGIIMREKSQVMYFLFFVIYYYLAQKKYNKFMKLKKLKLKKELLKKEEQLVLQ